MIPLRDDNPAATVPYVTRGLIVLNVAMFIYELMLGPLLRSYMFEWGLVPIRLTLALRYGEGAPAAAAATLFTSTFLHGGWAHLIGNMWYLWIFGDNIEDVFGHGRFVLFYVFAGVFAGTIHLLTNPLSRLPTVGASGAIAAVLGAYAVAFPRAKVVTLVPLFPFFQVLALPAMLVLGLWFVFQLFTGALSLTWSSGSGGIAWWAHIGGFAFGAVAMKLARLRQPREVSGAWVE